MTRLAVDLGTNTLRWFLDDGAGATERGVVMCGLGRDLERTSAFDPDALRRVDEALAPLAASVSGDTRIRAVSTAVARRVRDVEPLASIVRERLGVDLEVLSGEDEAALAARGVLGGGAGLAPVVDGGPAVICDIGGGSTEFVLVVDGVVGSSLSLDLGARTLTDQYIESDPPAPSELSAALSIVELFVDDLRRERPAIIEALDDGAPLIMVGGTATTVAAVEVGLLEWDPTVIHGFELDRAAAEDVFRTLVTEPAEDRAHNPGLPADRVEVIVGGTCVFIEIIRQLGVASVTMSVTDLLDGLLASIGDGE